MVCETWTDKRNHAQKQCFPYRTKHTDYRGEEYERIEYTPYGELWIEKVKSGVDRMPFRFTGKELDEETGLYYYGARYLDPKTSRWLSADPAMGEYIPRARSVNKLSGGDFPEKQIRKLFRCRKKLTDYCWEKQCF